MSRKYFTKKQSIKMIMVCLIPIFLNGCATSPKKEYDRILNRKPELSIERTKELVKSSGYSTIEISKEDKFRLQENLPIIDMVSYYSNAKLYKTNLAGGKKYKVTLKTLCDCLGFRKTIVVPKVHIFDVNGALIKETDMKFSPKPQGMILPSHFVDG